MQHISFLKLKYVKQQNKNLKQTPINQMNYTN